MCASSSGCTRHKLLIYGYGHKLVAMVAQCWVSSKESFFARMEKICYRAS
jgi:hypothetical protein